MRRIDNIGVRGWRDSILLITSRVYFNIATPLTFVLAFFQLRSVEASISNTAPTFHRAMRATWLPLRIPRSQTTAAFPTTAASASRALTTR